MILTAASELYQMQQAFNLATQADRLHQIANTSWQQSKAQ